MENISQKNEKKTQNIKVKTNSVPVHDDKYIFRALYLNLPSYLKEETINLLMVHFGYQSAKSVYNLFRIPKNTTSDMSAEQFLTLCKFFEVEPWQALNYDIKTPEIIIDKLSA